MAEHTKAHLWVNTLIACGALAVAGFSGIVSWKSLQLKNESIGFVQRPTFDCRVEYEKIEEHGALGICWNVTITNESDSRTSLVLHQAQSVREGGGTFFSGFTEVEDGHGKAVPFPVVLDAGEARSYVIRVPFEVPETVAKIINPLISGTNSQLLSLNAIKAILSDASLDLVGNSVEVKKYGDERTISWIKQFTPAIGQVKFFTGRGGLFTLQVVFPTVIALQ
jgi:hypothetical protein